MCIPVASEFDPVMPIDATWWPSVAQMCGDWQGRIAVERLWLLAPSLVRAPPKGLFGYSQYTWIGWDWKKL
jgi:hypothetical protein